MSSGLLLRHPSSPPSFPLHLSLPSSPPPTPSYLAEPHPFHPVATNERGWPVSRDAICIFFSSRARKTSSWNRAPPPFPLQRAPLGPVPTGRGGARRGRAGCRSKLVDSESCPWLSPICISNINGHVALWSLAFCTPTAGGGTYQGQYLSRDSSSGDHPPDRS